MEPKRSIRQTALWVACLWVLSGAPAIAQEPPPLSTGQTIYVPVYSHVWHGNIVARRGEAERIDVSTLVSVRNVDPKRAIRIEMVRCFDSQGKPLRDYVAAPQEIPPLGTREYFVEQKDPSGGSGANFLIKWDAPVPANPPLVEAVVVYYRGTQAFAFTSPGRVIRAED